MHRPNVCAIALAVLAFWTKPGAGQTFDYGAYRPARLTEIVADLPKHAEDWFAAGETRFRTQAIFTGRFRAAPKERQTFIAGWANATGHTEKAAGVFEQEVEIEQGESRYWMPIQEVLVAQLKAEVPVGAPVELYVLLMGTQAHQPVFAVSEFDAESDVHAEAEPPGKTEP